VTTERSQSDACRSRIAEPNIGGSRHERAFRRPVSEILNKRSEFRIPSPAPYGAGVMSHPTNGQWRKREPAALSPSSCDVTESGYSRLRFNVSRSTATNASIPRGPS
jgi:hypothetical protein